MKKTLSAAVAMAASLGMLGLSGMGGGNTRSKPRLLSRPRKNPKDPHQAARIKAAEWKRERKAMKRRSDAASCYYFNQTTGPLYSPDWLRKRREPFYIAK